MRGTNTGDEMKVTKSPFHFPPFPKGGRGDWVAGDPEDDEEEEEEKKSSDDEDNEDDDDDEDEEETWQVKAEGWGAGGIGGNVVMH